MIDRLIPPPREKFSDVQWDQWFELLTFRLNEIIDRLNQNAFTVTTFTTPGSFTFNVAASTKFLKVICVGGGGGGAKATGTPPGSSGSTSQFSTLILAGGGQGGSNVGGIGGNAIINSPAIPIARINGSDGATASNVATSCGGHGGSSFFGGAGRGGINVAGNRDGLSAKINSGSGGGGGSPISNATTPGGGGGGSGAFCEAILIPTSTSYPVTVGAGGNGGTAGGGGGNGGNGASGIVIIYEYI